MSKKLRASIRASVVLFGLGAVTYASSAMACGDDVKVQHASWQGEQGSELFHLAQAGPGNHWRQTAPSRYHLNHYALSYDPALGTINARVIIKEDVTLNPTGTSYSGSFTLDVYDPSGTTQVGHQNGQVTAQRVSAN